MQQVSSSVALQCYTIFGNGDEQVVQHIENTNTVHIAASHAQNVVFLQSFIIDENDHWTVLRYDGAIDHYHTSVFQHCVEKFLQLYTPASIIYTADVAIDNGIVLQHAGWEHTRDLPPVPRSMSLNNTTVQVYNAGCREYVYTVS